MQAVERVLSILEDIEGAGAKRVVERRLHSVPVFLKLGLARDHFNRRRPAWPHALVLNAAAAAPGEAVASDADAVAHGFAVAQNQIKEAVGRIDDDGTGNFRRREIDDLTTEFRPEL